MPEPSTSDRRAGGGRWRRLGARALALGLLVGLAGAAGLLPLRLVGPVEGRVGPGRVALAARADASPVTELLLPPLGSVSAGTHRAPLSVSARVEEVDL